MHFEVVEEPKRQRRLAETDGRHCPPWHLVGIRIEVYCLLHNTRSRRPLIQVRSAIPHSGEAGSLIEGQFRSQLTDVLPEKIGVSHGFVVDSDGRVSETVGYSPVRQNELPSDIL